MKVEFSPSSVRDFETIGDWIARDNPRRALSFVKELQNACMKLRRLPARYPLAEGFEDRGIRKKAHGNYLIFYRVIGNRVEVVHVLHGAIDLEAMHFFIEGET